MAQFDLVMQWLINYLKYVNSACTSLKQTKRNLGNKLHLTMHPPHELSSIFSRLRKLGVTTDTRFAQGHRLGEMNSKYSQKLLTITS